MVRLLLNASDAAYDSATKKYTFTLDRRIDRPTSIKVVKAVFKAATQSGTAYPLVLYVRSDALHAVIRDKHTLRVKGNNHEQTENILCTLYEDDRVGCYESHDSAQRRMVTDPHKVLKVIDVYFTNNDTLMAGVPTGTNDGTLNDLLEQHNAGHLVFYADMKHGLLDTSGNPVTANGTSIGSIQCRYPADGSVTFARVGGALLEYGDFGDDGAKSFTQSDGAAWDYFYDTSVANIPNSGTIFLLFQTDATPESYERPVKIILADLVLMGGATPKFTMRDYLNVYHPILENIVKEKPYLLELRYTKTGQNAHGRRIMSYDLRATRLDLNTTTSGTLSGIESPSLSNDRCYWGGNGQFHADSFFSDLILCNTNATCRTKCEGYLKNLYGGTGAPADGTNAQWLLEVDISQKHQR
jgi:hypothetical protein